MPESDAEKNMRWLPIDAPQDALGATWSRCVVRVDETHAERVWRIGEQNKTRRPTDA